jgi:dTDP-D-glucose 4,6-dehydratase
MRCQELRRRFSIPRRAAQIVYKENTADDPSRRRPDITKAKTLLGWEPRVALRDGLVPMVDDFRKRLRISDQIAEERARSAANSAEKSVRPAAANGGA